MSSEMEDLHIQVKQQKKCNRKESTVWYIWKVYNEYLNHSQHGGLLLHFLFCTSLAGQGFPPFSGFCWIMRLRSLRPFPQVLEHGDQSVQGLTTQSMTSSGENDDSSKGMAVLTTESTRKMGKNCDVEYPR
ncbi:hypothetical protein AVEN_174373-1 [Araneus ventricosus]|uniref:Uncharacterized protein n=1 Tax=Araneus ventricosus TaxID=182803 RepID=A0A4Y2KG83_ARAVE|nr:hypothetical protein AVEN_104721-1 [Araneus ventricosus]GBN01026.1 hypothetical protein AVEN_136553-1 [Araneus ventricosus]GBN01030.1 hypothetical protein AVEN_150710-1 [Araneus ventricosus]GBN01034.1 hypothetical protein AVEN_174373-1 [Araneus ventricosus]